MDRVNPARSHGSDRMAAIQPPIIPLIGEMVRRTEGCISFGQGVAYYDPPRQAFDAVHEHLSLHSTHLYGPVTGLPQLRNALSNKLREHNHIHVDRDYEIIVTAGSNMAFSSLMVALADVGDEIILPSPFYFNHEMAIRMANCVPVLVPTLSNYHLDLEALSRSIGQRTRAIVTVSPNNPTGAVYSREELQAVNALCVQHGIYHISDEAYEDFVFCTHSHYSPASQSGAAGHTISLYSFSKSYGFAGWRIGYIVLPRSLADAYKKVQDTVLISPTVIAQHAAVGALKTGPEFLAEKLNHLDVIRQHIVTRLQSGSKWLECTLGEGAFYLFCRIQTPITDLSLAQQLIKDHGVALIPGSTFGMHKGCYLRLSYGAVQLNDVDLGIDRLLHGINTICRDQK